MKELEKDLDKAYDKAGTYRSPLASANAKVSRTASELDGVREWSKEDQYNWKSAIGRSDAASERKRYKAKRLSDSLYKKRDKIMGAPPK